MSSAMLSLTDVALPNEASDSSIRALRRQGEEFHS